MAQFSVDDQTRRIRAVVSGTNQQEFSVAFQSNATTDIKVFVEGTQKTEGTHYDIKATTGGSAAAGLKADGTCVVKFKHDSGAGIDHRPTQNQVVTIISDIAVARTSVYTAGGNITADALESDFDTLTMQIAEREEAAGRALTAPKFDPTDIDMTLPDKDTRKGKALGFNATTGNPEALPPGDITEVTASTGLSGGGTAGAVTLSIDSTVATLSGTQTLTNKSIDAAQLTGTIDDARIPAAATDSAGLMSAADKAKLDGVEASATADQTAAEIRTLVGSASDSNVFTDADHSKLDGIEASATADQTASEIKTAYESNSDTNAFTDADHSKLDGIEASADVTDTANVVAALTAGTNVTIANNGTISSTDTNTTYSNATTSAAGLMSSGDKTKLDGIETDATADQTASEILTAIKTVDGASSGLDADLLDGQEGSYYTGYADTAVSNLVDSAPSTLDTLNELAAALGDDANFSTTVTNSIATKLPLAGGTMTGNIVMSGTETVDGRDLSVDGAKLDGIEASATADQTAAEIRTLVESASDSNVFTDADHTKLNGIEASADVTDATNVAAAGALMDSEVTNLAQVKAFDASDYATAAQGTTADAAMPKAGGTFTGDVTFTGDNYNIVFDKSDDALEFADNAKAKFGAGDDLQIYHNGTHSFIREAGTGDLRIQATNLALESGSGELFMDTTVDGAVELYYDNSKKLETTSGGIDVTGTVTDDGATHGGDVTFTGDNYNVVWDKSEDRLEFADNASATFGAGADLRLFHNGSISYIQDAGTGGLRIIGNLITLLNAANNETMLVATEDGAVELYHDNAKKLETTSGGIDVTGTVTDDGATHDGDVTFTGASYNVLWDKSDNALEFADNAVAAFGAGDDLKIYHDGSNSYVEDAGTGNLNIKSTFANIFGAGGTSATFYPGNAVTLYYNNVEKLATTADGVVISSTDAGASAAPSLQLYRNSASPADNDDVGQIQFHGENDADEKVEYGRIDVQVRDVSDGTEDGQIDIVAMRNGSSTVYQRMSFGLSQFYQTIYLGASTNIQFEGANYNDHETTLTVADPTADRTITLPDATGQVVLSDGAIDTNASAEIGRAHIGHVGHGDYAGFSHVDANSTTNYALLQHPSGYTYLNAASGAYIYFRINNVGIMTMDANGLNFAAGKVITFEGTTADDHETTLTAGEPTDDRTITLPDATGTVLTTGNSDTPTTTTSSGDADFVLVDDGGTMKKITPANLGIGAGSFLPLSGGTLTGALTTRVADDVVLTVHSDTDTTPTAALALMRGANDTFGADGYVDWKIENGYSDSGSYGGTLSIFSKSGGAAATYFVNMNTRTEFLTDVVFEQAIVEKAYECTGTALDPSNGTLQYKTLGSNTTFTESFVDGESITLMIDDGSGYTVTWPTMTWSSGSAPTLATSGYTTVVLWHRNGLYGAVVS